MTWVIEALGVFGFFSGTFILFFGNWRKFGLKYAAVALSTAAAALLIVVHVFDGKQWVCAPGVLTCELNRLIFAVRNLSIIIFHIACGRDAWQFKGHERRLGHKDKENRRAA